MQLGDNFVSVALVGFCNPAGIVAANTFDIVVDSVNDLGSLFTAVGLSLRCDYLLFDVGATLVSNSLSTWAAFQMANKKNDHLPVRVAALFSLLRCVL